jgi:hypothetical protein
VSRLDELLVEVEQVWIDAVTMWASSMQTAASN